MLRRFLWASPWHFRARRRLELGRTVEKDEARLSAAYDLALREIVARLKTGKKGAGK